MYLKNSTVQSYYPMFVCSTNLASKQLFLCLARPLQSQASIYISSFDISQERHYKVTTLRSFVRDYS